MNCWCIYLVTKKLTPKQPITSKTPNQTIFTDSNNQLQKNQTDHYSLTRTSFLIKTKQDISRIFNKTNNDGSKTFFVHHSCHSDRFKNENKQANYYRLETTLIYIHMIHRSQNETQIRYFTLQLPFVKYLGFCWKKNYLN